MKQGLIQMRMTMRAGLRALSVLALVGGLCAPVAAQEMSEKSVVSLMDYAWALTPERFTKPDGVTVEIDKKKREAVTIPVNVARDVIKVGRLSAHAHMCQLADDQTSNYRSLMRREEQKKVWSEPQLIYMSQLHLVTVMLLTGKLALIEREEGKEPKVVEEVKGTESRSCTPEQQAKVKEAIAAYVKTGPSLAAASKAGGADKAAATPASAPATPAKK